MYEYMTLLYRVCSSKLVQPQPPLAIFIKSNGSCSDIFIKYKLLQGKQNLTSQKLTYLLWNTSGDIKKKLSRGALNLIITTFTKHKKYMWFLQQK